MLALAMPASAKEQQEKSIYLAEAEAIFFNPNLPLKERTLKAVAARLNLPYGTVKNWSYQNNWAQRRRDFSKALVKRSEDRFTRLAEEGLLQVEMSLQVGRGVIEELSATDEDGNLIVPLNDRVKHLKTVGTTLKQLVETLERATGEDERKKTRTQKAKPASITANFGAGSQTLFSQGWTLPDTDEDADEPDELCDSECDSLRLEEQNG